MGKGGSSKSSQSSTNVSGQNGIQGDNLGAAISGINGSTVNVQSTDYGAIDKATQLSELAMTTAGNTSNKAMSEMSDTASKAMSSVSDFAGKALSTYSATNSENLQTMSGLAGNQAKQNEKNIDAMLKLAEMQQDGGQIQTTQEMTKVMLGAMVIVGVVIYGMSK